MDIQSGQLEEQISDLQMQIFAEKQRAKILQQKRASAAEASSLTDSQNAKERLLNEVSF